MAKHVYISKLDAAKRQLETAIRLFFNNADMVSIHTLACTSHGLLRDLCNKQGLKSFIKDDYIDFIKKEKQAEFRKMITAPANFFKHADKDPQEAIKFYYETTPFFMWDSYRMYYQLTKEMPPMMKLFNIWFCAKHPDTIADEQIKKASKLLPLYDFDPENKQQFLQLLPQLSEIK